MPAQHEGYYIGLMTGTSMDAVDTVLIEIKDGETVKLQACIAHEFPDELRNQVATVSNGTSDSLHELMLLDHQLAKVYASCIKSLLAQASLTSNDIYAIGSHGQTVRHCPDCTPPYTLQLGNAAQLAEQTGITVVNDFRQRDLAAGGQGAPLAPLFHHHLFAQTGKTIVGVNLGGVANISILLSQGGIQGFDTGPANNLMDQWTERQLGKRYDKDAAWAKSGEVDDALLTRLLSETWLSRPPPKSTGPELFNQLWLDQHTQGLDIQTENVQRTLCEYSAITLTEAIIKHAPDCEELVVCGGGAYNPLLLERIQHYLPDTPLVNSSKYGIEPDWIEATMFAWLAYRTLNGLPGNVPAVTGADHEVVLGAIHPV